MLAERSILIRQKLMENAKTEKLKQEILEVKLKKVAQFEVNPFHSLLYNIRLRFPKFFTDFTFIQKYSTALF